MQLKISIPHEEWSRKKILGSLHFYSGWTTIRMPKEDGYCGAYQHFSFYTEKEPLLALYRGEYDAAIIGSDPPTRHMGDFTNIAEGKIGSINSLRSVMLVVRSSTSIGKVEQFKLLRDAMEVWQRIRRDQRV